MTGTVVLQGGGPFVANDDLDAQLIEEAGAGGIVVLPTADAFEHPERLIAAAMDWGERLSVDVEALMVLGRHDALDDGAARVVNGARAVYLVGDQPLHLRSVLKDTPVWDAVQFVLSSGGLVVANAGSAAALCDPMVDPRGGAFTLGLGLVRDLALVTQAEDWTHERLHRTLRLADTTVATIPTGAALVRRDRTWTSIGEVTLQGALPG